MKTSDQLIERVGLFKSGKTEEFTSIYEESYKYLHTCIIHIVKDEDIAQDMLQDTYVEICRNVEQLKKDEDFLSWAAVIANRKCFAYLKKIAMYSWMLHQMKTGKEMIFLNQQRTMKPSYRKTFLITRKRSV